MSNIAISIKHYSSVFTELNVILPCNEIQIIQFYIYYLHKVKLFQI